MIRSLFFFFVGVLIAFCLMVPFAYASDAVGPFTGSAVGGTVNYSSQPTTTYTKMVEKATGAIQDVNDVLRIPNKATTTLPNGQQIEADLVTDIKKSTIRQGIWNAIKKGKGNPWVNACFILCPPLIEQGWEWMNDAKEWVSNDDPLGGGFYYKSYTSGITRSASEWVAYGQSVRIGTIKWVPFDILANDYRVVIQKGTGACTGNFDCLIDRTFRTTQTIPKTPVTDSQIDQAADAAMNTVSPADLITIADNSFYTIGDDGIPIYQPIPLYDAQQFVSPTNNYISSPEKTVKIESVKNPDGSITTTETKQRDVTNVTTNSTSNSTVNNTSLTYNTSTVTNTYVNGSTTPSTTTETPQKEDQDTGSVTDKTMPDLPELYKPKYPDGPQGVWNTNKPNIQTTAFYQGVRSMFPTFGGGSCPVFSIPSIALGPFGNFGSFVFDVPCWIYQAIGLILMTTAAFTARKIIF